jgi:CLN3 protein
LQQQQQPTTTRYKNRKKKTTTTCKRDGHITSARRRRDDGDDDEARALVHFQVSQEPEAESDDVSPPRYDDNDDDSDHGNRDMRMIPISSMTTRQRSRLVLQLWKYMIPLFVVYAAEYACQGGAWAAIGFPTVSSRANRAVFYTNANWLYQAGVFVSRSSGNVFPTISLPLLWFLPAWQVVHFVLFTWIAAHGSDDADDDHDVESSESSTSSSFFRYKASILYTMAFGTGLLGGAVYAHGYQRIVADYSPSSSLSLNPRRYYRRRGGANNHQNNNTGHAEFALATVSVAESFGILVAFVQACLYKVNHLSGAIATCHHHHHHPPPPHDDGPPSNHQPSCSSL